MGDLVTFTDVEIWSLFGAFVMMAFDLLSGIVCAFVRHDFQSSKMREGIGHKSVMLLVIILAVIVQNLVTHVPDLGIDAPIVVPVCVYMILMEVASVLETVRDTYPDIADASIFKLFGGRENE